MRTLNFILEQLSGVASVLTFCLLVFLTFYLWDWLSYKHRSGWDALLIGLPPAIALAAILYLNEVGALMTRMVAWVWRAFYGGSVPLTSVQLGFIIGGTVISSTAILLMIRLLTMPRLGNWPWIASAISAAVYLVISMSIHWWFA